MSTTRQAQPIIDKQTFEQVQRQLEAHNYAGQKQRDHHHYLKGTLFCGKENEHGEECGCRLIICNAKSRNKTIYPYFVCIGRQRSRTSCFQRALPIDFLEDAVVDYYQTVELAPELRLRTEQYILEEISEFRKSSGAERQTLVTKQRRALDKRTKLLDAHLAGAVPLDLLKIEQHRLTNELDHIEQRLAVLDLKFDVIEVNLKAALALRRQSPRRLQRGQSSRQTADQPGHLRTHHGLLRRRDHRETAVAVRPPPARQRHRRPRRGHTPSPQKETACPRKGMRFE